ncbi:hypothetical protein V6N11_070293 [Hibiscus sabdariffa]|uniref:CCHC-type domain-containing protein n=1 Tax=Hibiscus sabdariffa TaxID=183260 RepID=A0ABR2QEL0_9ROSI
MSFVVQAGLKSRGRGEGKDKGTTCYNCNRKGHDSDNCFELIGYPEWWGDRHRRIARGYGKNKGRQQFVNSGSKGCGGVKANVVQASTTEVVGNNIISDSDKTAITGLSNKQWETLRTLLSGCLECLSDVRDVTRCPVGLPNGNQITATKEGTMVFDNKLTLNHVLYVPSLMCNLISLSQLLDETNCVAQFTDKFCVIQDRTSRMLIGAGEQQGGLYYFRTMATTTAMKMSGQSTFDMWHKRLGHLSSKNHKGDKFISRSRKCIFVGYPYGKKGWRVYDLELGVFFVSRDVVFFELEFPYLTNTGSNKWNGGNENDDVVVVPQDNNGIIVETESEECDNDEVRGCNAG